MPVAIHPCCCYCLPLTAAERRCRPQPAAAPDPGACCHLQLPQGTCWLRQWRGSAALSVLVQQPVYQVRAESSASIQKQGCQAGGGAVAPFQYSCQPTVPSCSGSCACRPLRQLEPHCSCNWQYSPAAASGNQACAAQWQLLWIWCCQEGGLVVAHALVDFATWCQVMIQYKSSSRLLQDAQRIWAHVGHSGWQWTRDVELFRSPQSPCSWSGIYKLPASQLATPGHAAGAVPAWNVMQCNRCSITGRGQPSVDLACPLATLQQH